MRQDRGTRLTAQALDLALLKRLCEACGVAGQEDQVRELVLTELRSLVDEVSVDSLGNVVGIRRGKGERRAMVAGHLDEVGFMARYVDDEGFIRIQPVGALDPRELVAQRVIVHASNGEPLRGILASAVGRLRLLAGGGSRTPRIDELFVDVGLPGPTVKRLVELGDMITLDRTGEQVGQSFVSKALDGRVGLFVMIEALRRVRSHEADLLAVATVQKEVGSRGAVTSAYLLEPHVGIALDVTPAVDFSEAKRDEAVSRLGDGVAIGLFDPSVISNGKLARHFRDVARREAIRHQIVVSPHGASDAGAIQRARGGVPAIALSIPTRYLHSGSELASLVDVAAAADLLACYLEEAHSRDYGVGDPTGSPARAAPGSPRSGAPTAEAPPEHRQAEAEPQPRPPEALQAIERAIERAALAATSSREIANQATRQLRAYIPCQHVSTILYDYVAGSAEILAVDESAALGDPVGTRYSPADLGPWAYERNGPLHYAADITAVEHPWPLLDPLAAKGVRSLLVASLLVEGEAIGALNLMSTTPAAFTGEQQAAVREVAEVLAISIHHAQLSEALRRRAAELERQVAESNSARRAASADLGSFAYSVAHDLRAPLRAIQGFSQVLSEDYGSLLDAMGQEYLERIQASAVRLDSLIQALLAYNRIVREELTLGRVSLGQVVVDARALAETFLNERAAVVSVVGDLPDVLGQRAALAQALANLLTNAAKFVASGTRPRIRLWAEERAGLIRLWVEDNGIGIAPEHQAQIFGVFGRLHGVEEYPGTGIGLAIARKTLERLGGTVGVESALGQGSRFWIELPMAPVT